MKRIWIKVLAAAAVVAVLATAAVAAGRGIRRAGTGSCPGNRTVAGCLWTDADGDGVCDYCGTVACQGQCRGAGYTDVDGDGVCDHYGASRCTGRWAGQGGHHR